MGEACVTSPAVLSAVGLSKHFGRVSAVTDVSFTIGQGEVVGLVGDNGAGKSTLVGMLSGAIAPSEGFIEVDGDRVNFTSPMQARLSGIETVYQDLSLAVDLSVWANIYLGREELRPGLLGALGMLNRPRMIRRTIAELDRLGITLPSVMTPCDQLSGGQRQAVAVSRAVTWGSKVLLLDEPTANLGVEQQGHVAELVEKVKQHGIPVLFISHNLPQLHNICDRILVMYHGALVADLVPSHSSVEEVIRWITGAAVGDHPSPARSGTP